jgi:hypothetical protein
MGKHGIIGEVIMWAFLGAAAVLVLTHGSGFSTAVGTVVQPLEYETSLIATAGSSSASSKGTSKYPV